MKRNASMKGVSVRMNVNDLDRLRRIAERLSVRDSDIIRFSVKSTLRRLAPLAREDSGDHDLLPVFIEHGAELARAFDLCADKLDRIINRNPCDDGNRVSRRDIELLTISGVTDSYQQLHIREAVNPDNATTDVGQLLREYLYRKYLVHEQAPSHRKAGMKLVPG